MSTQHVRQFGLVGLDDRLIEDTSQGDELAPVAPYLKHCGIGVDVVAIHIRRVDDDDLLRIDDLEEKGREGFAKSVAAVPTKGIALAILTDQVGIDEGAAKESGPAIEGRVLNDEADLVVLNDPIADFTEGPRASNELGALGALKGLGVGGLGIVRIGVAAQGHQRDKRRGGEEFKRSHGHGGQVLMGVGGGAEAIGGSPL